MQLKRGARPAERQTIRCVDRAPVVSGGTLERAALRLQCSSGADRCVGFVPGTVFTGNLRSPSGAQAKDVPNSRDVPLNCKLDRSANAGLHPARETALLCPPAPGTRLGQFSLLDHAMKKRWVVLISVVLTLAVEVMLLQSWLIRGLVLDVLDDPRPDYDRALVLTKRVELRDSEKKVGDLQPGQVLFAPCRHDQFLTEPFDPRVWKIYVEFGANASWDSNAATIKGAENALTTRQCLSLMPDGSNESGGPAKGNQPIRSETNRMSSAAASRR